MANEKYIYATLLQDVRLESEWSADNTIVPLGKMCFSSDNNYAYKVGDGESTWNELAYARNNALDVYRWAKAETKPSYTAEEVGLGNVENITTEELKSKILTALNINTALGYTPASTDIFVGATSTNNGVAGLVPAPLSSNGETFFLNATGGWKEISTATTSKDGLLSKSDKAKLDTVAEGANAYTHPVYSAQSEGMYKVTVDASGHVSKVSKITKDDIVALGIPAQDTNTTYSVFNTTTDGLVPKSTESTGRFLKDDGTWDVPTDTTYSTATQSSDGLFSKEDKAKLDGIADGATKYFHPNYTAFGEGLYKVTVNGTGHVTKATSVTKADITALGIPEKDTTYSEATESTSGLMSASDKVKLDNVEEGANNYKHPTANEYVEGFYKVTVDGTGHVTKATEITKDDISDLGVAITDTTYGEATTSNSGLMSASDKTKLNGLSNYTHYSGTTAITNKFVKVTVNSEGHVTGTTEITKADITALGIPESNTTYSEATTSTAGLMSASDKTKLDGLSNYTLPTASTSLGGVKTTSSVSSASGYTACPIISGVVYYKDTNTTYSEATTSNSGLMSASDKTKLDGLENYTHYTGTQARAKGLWVIAFDEKGHIIDSDTMTKAHITALGIPAQDTVYTLPVATASALGGVKSGTDITVNSSGDVSVNNDSHTHSNSTITSLDASKLTGTISIDRLPKGAVERCVVVTNDTARLALTSDSVQTGDTVKVSETGKMYFVVDDSALGTESAFEEYSASTDWSLISNIPSTFTPSTHNHTCAQITDLETKLSNYALADNLTSHIEDTTHITSSERTNWNSAYSHSTSAHARTDATATAKSSTNGNILINGSEVTVYSHPTATAKSSGLYKVTINGTGHVTATTAVTKDDISDLGVEITDTTYSDATTSSAGLMSASDKTKLDGLSNYSLPTASTSLGGVKTTSSVSSNSGYTACPIIDGVVYYKDTDTTYSNATTSNAGLMSASDKTKLDGLSNYSLPTASSSVLGGVKTTSTVTSNSGYTACPIISGVVYYKDTNTTYNEATTSNAGLMSASDKTKLNSLSNYTHYTGTTAVTSKFVKVTVNSEGHVTGTTEVTKDDISGLGVKITDTTYSEATTSTAGLMSASDKTKLNGLSNYILPTASTSLGGVKTTSNISDVSGYTACPIVSGVVYYKDTNTTYSNATTSSAGLMSASDKSKLDGLSNYTHYTGTTAVTTGFVKVTVNSEGHVTGTTAVTKADITNLGIPAQDTDTHWTSKNVVTSSTTGTANTTSALSNGSVFLNHIENGSVRSTHKISGSGATTVTTDASGNIIISSTTYSLSSFGVNASATELNYSVGVTSNIQNQLNSKADLNSNNTFNGEQRMSIAGGITDIANGIQCSLKNARALDNQLIVAEVYAPYTSGTNETTNMTSTAGQIDFYKIDSISSGAGIGSKTKLASLNSEGFTANAFIGNASTATKLKETKNIKIGNATKAFDGSSNITYTLSEIGAAESSHTHTEYASSTHNHDTVYASKTHTHSEYASSTHNHDDVYAKTSHNHTASAITDLFSAIYPVGIVIPFANTSDPNTLFTGTTWTQVAQGKVLIGEGTGNDGTTSKTFTVGSTGGKYQATLTEANLPAHSHSINLAVQREAITAGSGSTTGYIPATGTQTTATYSASGTTGSTGSGTGFDILSPYMTVKYWQRTA